MLEQVFRLFKVANLACKFGDCLSPFAIVIHGHPEETAAANRAHKAMMVESGNSISASDAAMLVSNDSKMPTTVRQMEEKLYGWSIMVDVFHGPTHRIARNVRNAVRQLGPELHGLMIDAGSEEIGLDRCIRVAFDLQQDYFMWCNAVSRENNSNDRTPAPDFAQTIAWVKSRRPTALSALPDSWAALLPRNARPASLTPLSAASRPAQTAVTNTHANERLVRRFKESGHSSTMKMIEGKEVTIPKFRGNPVCMNWAFKGACSSGCKRAALHVEYPESVTTALHAVLSKCDVAQLE
jgi:hypothetical protein